MDTISTNNTSSPSTDLPSKSEGIVWCCVLALEAVLIVVGNLLTIVLFAVNKNLRKKSLFLVINMAFADVLGGAYLPLDIYLYIGDIYHLWKASSSTSLYFFHIMIFYSFFLASLISAALISGERFYAIYWPLKHLTLSNRRYRMVIFISWTIAFLVSIVCAVLAVLTSIKIAMNTLMSCFLPPLFIICGCNIGIWKKFKQGSIASEMQNRASQKQRLTKTLLLVSFIALLSWIPMIIVSFINEHENSLSLSIFHTTYALSVTNSFLNPLVYALRIQEFRQALGWYHVKKQAAINTEGLGRRMNTATAMPSLIQLTSLKRVSGHPQSGEEAVEDTKC